MALVTYKDKKTSGKKLRSQVFSGFSTQGRDFQDSKMYDIELVKQDLLNHFNIRKGEKLENPDFGVEIWSHLFDPLDEETKNSVIEDVETVIAYDPRVQLDSMQVDDYEHGLQIRVSLIYVYYGIGETLDLLFDDNQGLLTSGSSFYSANQIN